MSSLQYILLHITPPTRTIRLQTAATTACRDTIFNHCGHTINQSDNHLHFIYNCTSNQYIISYLGNNGQLYAVRLFEFIANKMFRKKLAKLKVKLERYHWISHHCNHCITILSLTMNVPNFGVFSFKIAPVMLDVIVVWLTCEHGTEMGTPLPVLNKHRKLSPVSGEGRPELIIRVIYV